MHGTSDYYNTGIRDTGSSYLLLSRSSRLLVARKQSLARLNAITSLGNTRKDNQRPERELTNQSATIGKDRVGEKGRVMFGRKKHARQEQLVKKANKKLDQAADKAVKEAKNTQEIIIANGFTLELLLAMGGKAKHD